MSPGDRVRCIDPEDRMHGKRGTVTTVVDETTVMVRWEDGDGHASSRIAVSKLEMERE